jgi:hypothetical protein
MARMTLCLILLFSLCLLMAQEITPWQYVRHSAVDNAGSVHVRFNGSPTILNEYELFNFSNSAWQESVLTNPEPLVYEALLPYSAGQNLQYRLRTSYDLAGQNVVALNPAYLDSDAFPPALASLAYIADDPVGDSVMVNYPNLDITGTWCGFSANKIYATMSNVTNTFPTSNSFTSYNMYFAGLANSATAITDSTFYGMLYTSTIPLVFSPGLYKFGLNFADTTVAFTRLGNIQSQVVGGKLMLACNISDLTADPSFGAWPPMFNALGFVAGTARIDIDLATMTPTFGLGDYSSLTQLIFEQYDYQVTQNSLPVISDVLLSYNGNICALEFTYNDANQDFPLYAKVILNDGNQTAVDITPTVPDFTQPMTMTAILPLPTSWETAEIRISDNNIDFVTYIISTEVEDETMPSAFACNAYPNPFNPANANLNITLSGLKNTPVKAAVYNLKGQCVKRLSAVSDKNSAILSWDGKTDDNKTAANGVYFLQLEQGSQSVSKKIIIIR